VGRLNTLAEQNATLDWATEYQRQCRPAGAVSSISGLKALFGEDLRRYFALAALSRSTTAPAQMVKDALALVFRVRVVLEQSIAAALSELVVQEGINALQLSLSPLHGSSKKQGVSIRMPLSSCVPSRLCGAACYAHDVLDAAPASVVRGAINGALASMYEHGTEPQRRSLMAELKRPIERMVRAAVRDAEHAAATFARRPRIRFAHVGEFAAFPEYANALAWQVRVQSAGAVDCVVYTRHPDAKLLDPSLFVVLFSLDESSEDRRRFVPPTARAVRSAFEGRITDTVDVNFLEHHRWVHIKPVGTGKICPSTAPDTKDRTCDGCKCDFCFTPKLVTLGLPP
jgi:hypothetical protein